MGQEIMSEEERNKLAALEMKNALGGVDKDEEQELFDMRKKKKLHEAVNR